MSARIIVGLVAAMLLVGGCGLSGGQTVVKYDKGSITRMTEAPQDGVYGLYSTADRTPKVSHRLEEGDPIGFKAGENGEVIAVAGEHEEPISPGLMSGTWYWKIAK